MIRLGLIGAGRWGRNFISTIAALDDVRLARLASRNPASAGLVSQECAISADWRSLVEAGDVDGIIIAAPPSFHAEMAQAAVAAGVPVLVEKPLTLRLAEAIALRDAVLARKGLVMVDHTHLFHPAFEELKRCAQSLGPVRGIEVQAGNHGPYRTDVPVLWDWGPHDVAMCLDLLRRSPQEVHATREAHERTDGADAEALRLELTFPEGLQARIRLSNMMKKTRLFTARCTAGALIYDDLARDKLVLERDGKRAPIEVSSELPLPRVVKAFTAAILAGKDQTGSLDLAVEVVAVLERCAKILARG